MYTRRKLPKCGRVAYMPPPPRGIGLNQCFQVKLNTCTDMLEDLENEMDISWYFGGTLNKLSVHINLFG